VKRLAQDQVVGLAVGDASIDCRVMGLSGGEAALAPLQDEEAALLPAASANATLVFNHRGGLVMLRGAMYRGAGGSSDLRFAEGSRRAPAPAETGEQRRRAARVEVSLPAAVAVLGPDGDPEGAERPFRTRDMSINGLALDTGADSFPSGSLLRFTLVLPDGTPITGQARVVRTAHRMAGLRYENVEPAARAKLASFLVSRQRPRTPAQR
jgi:hypothetical protein